MEHSLRRSQQYELRLNLMHLWTSWKRVASQQKCSNNQMMTCLIPSFPTTGSAPTQVISTSNTLWLLRTESEKNNTTKLTISFNRRRASHWKDKLLKALEPLCLTWKLRLYIARCRRGLMRSNWGSLWTNYELWIRDMLSSRLSLGTRRTGRELRFTIRMWLWLCSGIMYCCV